MIAACTRFPAVYRGCARLSKDQTFAGPWGIPPGPGQRKVGTRCGCRPQVLASRLLVTDASKVRASPAIWAHAERSSLRGLLVSYASNDGDTSPSQRHRLVAFARSVRRHGKVTFISLADGSLEGYVTVQGVLRHDRVKGSEEEREALFRRLHTGVALELAGRLEKSKSKGQDCDFVIEDLVVTGDCDAATYPIPLTASQAGEVNSVTSSEHNVSSSKAASTAVPDLRRFAHLRPRHARHATILKRRAAMERGIDDFFVENEFIRVAAPIITSSDCEGGGEVFRVVSGQDKAEQSFWSGTSAYLTVSAQLHLEALALGLGRVYTISPCFRAEGSATNRHLAEFWMCEGEQMTSSDPDIAFAEVTDTVEGLVREAITAVIASSRAADTLWTGDEDGLNFMRGCATDKDRWPRITYTEAIQRLQEAAHSSSGSDASSVPVPHWGESLSSEHERWLARDGPVFVTHYPAVLKPFYMRLDASIHDLPITASSEATVACFDLLVPRVGELAGGSLRETRIPVLQRRMEESYTTAVEPQTPNSSGEAGTKHPLSWYIDDLRRYGCTPLGGFGLGIERLLAWVTNTESVRDVVTFPRTKGRLRF